MRLNAVSWSFQNADEFWQDLSVIVDAFERVNHVEWTFCEVLQVKRIPTSPVIAKWHIVSLKVPSFGVGKPFAARSCALFENFPMLAHLELDHPVADEDASAPLSTAERHHKLPQPVSLALRRFFSNDVHYLVTGHLFSLPKKLRTIDVDVY